MGLGSIGKRHLQNIRTLDPDGHIIVWHTRAAKSDHAVDDLLADRVVYSFEEAVNPKPDVAFIATPAPAHIPVALRLAREGIDLFIEKPLSSGLTGVDELLDMQEKKRIILMVGYNLRFHPPLQVLQHAIVEGKIGRITGIRAEVGQYLPEWRPGTDYRTSVSARRELGGGAVLELSHELDYVLWLAGAVVSVAAQAGRVSDLEIDVEDTADMILKFASGAQGSIHLDMVQQPPVRCCRVTGTEGAVIWDFATDAVEIYSNRTGIWSRLCPGVKVDRNLMYIAELEHFLACVRERTEPLVTGADGRRVLQLALAALQSSREQRSIPL